LNKNNEEKSKKNVSEFERNMLLTFEEQEKLLLTTALSFTHSYCHFTESLPSQIDQKDDQGESSYDRLNDLEYSTSLCKQNYDEKKLQDKQQEKIAVQAMRENNDDNSNNNEKQQREK